MAARRHAARGLKKVTKKGGRERVKAAAGDRKPRASFSHVVPGKPAEADVNAAIITSPNYSSTRQKIPMY